MIWDRGEYFDHFLVQLQSFFDDAEMAAEAFTGGVQRGRWQFDLMVEVQKRTHRRTKPL